MIGFADKRMLEREHEVDGQLCNHERWLLSITVHFQSDVRLSSFDDFNVGTVDEISD